MPEPADDPIIAPAVARLRAGGAVAFPTETVYGLGVDATNADAVAKLYALKGRPASNPLIVHVAGVAAARRCSGEWNHYADRLAAAFWPGPLTLVLPKHASIVDAVAAGGATVGVRVPDHALALALLRAFDGPVAAPSANRSNHVSPTTAAHVRQEFDATGPDAPLVLDGGACPVGIESTVVDVTGDRPLILRPGHITADELGAVLGIAVVEAAASPASASASGSGSGSGSGSAKLSPIRSPGQLATHYAPRTPAFRFEAPARLALDLTNAVVLEPSLDPVVYARNLYARLRLLDTHGLRAIYIEMPPDAPEWRAVRDRLIRATRPLP